MEIGGWLQSLGLEQYEAAFREHFVDEKVLSSLTAEDLKDLGVGFVGHRRKLLDAIALLRADAPAKRPVTRKPLEGRNDAPRHRRAPTSHRDVLRETALKSFDFHIFAPKNPQYICRRGRVDLRCACGAGTL